MMQDSCYASNSSQFGLQFEYCGDFLTNSTTSSVQHPHTSLPATVNSTHNNSTINNNNNWIASEDSMNTTFGIPIDLDPLPSLFPFSPCNFKNEPIITNNHQHNNNNNSSEKQQPHDLTDVLLSLKHESIQHESNSSPSNSNEYTNPTYIHPQVSKSSNNFSQISTTNGNYVNGLCNSDQYLIPSSSAAYHHHHHHHHATTSPTIFPSMSVNVSMNMTMHGCSSTNLTCPEPIQWTTPAIQLATPQSHQINQASHTPNNHQMYNSPNQGATICASGSTSAMYMFTADFRPQTVVDCSNQINFNTNNNNNNSDSSCDSNIGYKTKKSCQISTLIDNENCSRKRSYCKSDKLSNLYFDEESTKPNLCRICGKTYARPSTLKTHLRTHSGEKPYRCINCNKSFSQAANLTAHVRTHSGERPFRCPICDRRFSQSSSVTTHMRTHSGERPYCCRMCKKAFSDSSTLTKHLRIHSGEKPYQCKLCLLRFSQSGNLNRHMRVHGSTNSAILIS